MSKTLNELATKVGFEVVNVDDGFINYEEIYNIVVDICDTTNNKHIISIPVDSINKVLWTNPWVTDVRTLIDLNSVLNVQLVECEPIVRIYNDKNKNIVATKENHTIDAEL